MTHPLSDEEIVARFTRVRAWTQGETRAPHKALLLLHTLARIQRGESSAVEYSSAEAEVSRLLRDFGPPNRPTRPQYPFWRLQNDPGLWSVTANRVIAVNSAGDVSPIDLREAHAVGHLDPAVEAVLRTRPDLVNRLAAKLVDDVVAESRRNDLLDSIGMPWTTDSSNKTKRDSKFRPEILRIYEGRCAVCDFDGQLGTTVMAVEAAHVKWHKAHGPDTADNGVALCSLHHKAFDSGAMGLDEKRRWIVSQHLRGVFVLELIRKFHGKPMRLPTTGEAPRLEYIAWHGKQVFCRPELPGLVT